MKLTKKETQFIKSQGVARLATISGEGTPHNVPVCPVMDRGNVYLGSERSNSGSETKNERQTTIEHEMSYAYVTPDLLRWARERQQLSARLVAEKLNIKPEIWRRGKKEPSTQPCARRKRLREN